MMQVQQYSTTKYSIPYTRTTTLLLIFLYRYIEIESMIEKPFLLLRYRLAFQKSSGHAFDFMTTSCNNVNKQRSSNAKWGSQLPDKKSTWYMHKGAMYVFSAIFFQSHCIITQWRAFSLLTKYLLISYHLTQMSMYGSRVRNLTRVQ